MPPSGQAWGVWLHGNLPQSSQVLPRGPFSNPCAHPHFGHPRASLKVGAVCTCPSVGQAEVAGVELVDDWDRAPHDALHGWALQTGHGAKARAGHQGTQQQGMAKLDAQCVCYSTGLSSHSNWLQPENSFGIRTYCKLNNCIPSHFILTPTFSNQAKSGNSWGM